MARVYVPCCAGPVFGSGATPGGGGGGDNSRAEWISYAQFWASPLTTLVFAPFYGSGESGSPANRFCRIGFNGIYSLEYVVMAIQVNGPADITMGLHINNNIVPQDTITTSIPFGAPTVMDFSAANKNTVAGQFVALGFTPAVQRQSYFITSHWRRV